jgi:uncharacterized protein YggE
MRSRIVLSLLVLALGIAAWAQTPTNVRTITVSAEASRDVKPDTALLSVSIESQAKTVTAAVTDNNKRATAVIAAIRALPLITGLQITTVGFSVQPQYNDYYGGPVPMTGTTQPGAVGGYPGTGAAVGGGYGTGIAMPGAPTIAPGYPTIDPSTPQIIGYQVSNSVQIRFTDSATSPLADTSGKILDAALSKGANSVGNVQFMLADEKPVMIELVATASRNARDLANALATGSGVTLGQVTSLQTGWSPMTMYNTSPMPMYAGAASMSPPIEVGSLTLRASVSATYEIK